MIERWQNPEQLSDQYRKLLLDKIENEKSNPDNFFYGLYFSAPFLYLILYSRTDGFSNTTDIWVTIILFVIIVIIIVFIINAVLKKQQIKDRAILTKISLNFKLNMILLLLDFSMLKGYTLLAFMMKTIIKQK